MRSADALIFQTRAKTIEIYVAVPKFWQIFPKNKSFPIDIPAHTM
jgi:hypothetical protein